MSIEIHTTTPAHAERVCAVIRASIRELCVADHGNDPEKIEAWLANKTVENVKTWALHPNNVFVHAVLSGHIAGAGCANLNGEIQLIYVDPAHRLSGVSSALLGHLENRLAAAGVTEARLISTKAAHEFYLNHEWSDADGTGGSLEMSKRLDPTPSQ